eukprot:m.81866 g.81866  ORF g.81866 m.81866 type:complete len:567 (-) comp25461_c0_seq1:46-1746(-)
MSDPDASSSIWKRAKLAAAGTWTCETCFFQNEKASEVCGSCATSKCGSVSVNKDAPKESISTIPTTQIQWNAPDIGDYAEIFGLESDVALNALWGRILDYPKEGRCQVRVVHRTVSVQSKNLRRLSLLEVTRKYISHLQSSTPEVIRPKTFDNVDASLVMFSPLGNLQSMEFSTDFLVALTKEDARADRAVGAIVGMCIADAVGHPLEFIDAVDVPYQSGRGWDSKTLEYCNPKNAFYLKPGQWTDDAAMGLCIADSLLSSAKLDQAFDGSDLRARFHAWWFRGYNNAFPFDNSRRHGSKTSVGLGGNISNSLYTMLENHKPTATFETNSEDAGNGSLMRLAPVPVRFWRDVQTASSIAHASSYTTHPGPIAACACGFMAFIIANVIAVPQSTEETENPKAILDKLVAEYLDLTSERKGSGWNELHRLLRSSEPNDSLEVNWNWKSANLQVQRALELRGVSYNGYPVNAGYFGSYSMDGLAMALHCVYHTASFSDAVERCVNFLGDADSTGSMVGQMCGAIYGLASIDHRLVEHMHTWDPHGNIQLRAALLFALGKFTSTTTSLDK